MVHAQLPDCGGASRAAVAPPPTRSPARAAPSDSKVEVPSNMKLHAQDVRRTAGALAVAAAAAGLVLTGCGKSQRSRVDRRRPTSGAATSRHERRAASPPPARLPPPAPPRRPRRRPRASVPFPTTVGDSWTYTNSNGTTTQNKITSATQVAAGQQVAMDVALQGQRHDNPRDLGLHRRSRTGRSRFRPASSPPPLQSGVTFKVVSGGIYWPSAAQLASGQPVHTTLTMQITVAGKTQTITEHITSTGRGHPVGHGPGRHLQRLGRERGREPRPSRATTRPSRTRPGWPPASARCRAS